MKFRTLDQVYSSSLDSQRFSLVIFTVFGVAALLLAAMGIYGVTSYAVAQRTQEIGIRMALGAQRTDVLRMVVRQGMALALIGIGVGVGGALGLTRIISSILFNVQATDPVTFIVMALILGFVALAACYLPARRAAKLDPMIALGQNA